MHNHHYSVQMLLPFIPSLVFHNIEDTDFLLSTTSMPGWSEFCPGQPNTKHAMINTLACPHCSAANPYKAKPEEQQPEVTTQDQNIITILSSSPPSPPRHVLPTCQLQAWQTPSSTHAQPAPQPPPALQARQYNWFESLSQNTSQAWVGAFTRRECQDHPHAGSNTHWSCQQYTSQPWNPAFHPMVFVYKCTKNLDSGQIISKWGYLGM